MKFKFKPLFPSYFDIELTNACQSVCAMCPREKIKEIGFMSDETFNNLFNAIRGYKLIKNIAFCGIGEPLLHPQILKYIEKLRQWSPDVKIGIITNGEKLTPETFEALKLLDVNPIIISIQALDEKLYNKLMNKLNYKKVIENIEYISKNQNFKTKISLSFVKNKLNENEIPKLIEFVESHNLKLGIGNIASRGGNLVNEELMDNPIRNEKIEFCNIFQNINFISWNGNIHPCCQDVSREYPIANINTHNMYDIAKIKNEILINNGLNYKICEFCNDKSR